jgi:hypothetical protein
MTSLRMGTCLMSFTCNIIARFIFLLDAFAKSGIVMALRRGLHGC